MDVQLLEAMGEYQRLLRRFRARMRGELSNGQMEQERYDCLRELFEGSTEKLRGIMGQLGYNRAPDEDMSELVDEVIELVSEYDTDDVLNAVEWDGRKRMFKLFMDAGGDIEFLNNVPFERLFKTRVRVFFYCGTPDMVCMGLCEDEEIAVGR